MSDDRKVAAEGRAARLPVWGWVEQALWLMQQAAKHSQADFKLTHAAAFLERALAARDARLSQPFSIEPECACGHVDAQHGPSGQCAADLADGETPCPCVMYRQVAARDAHSGIENPEGREARPLQNIIDRCVQRVAELPDRTSPDDWPDAMLVTGDELTAILTEELAARDAREGHFCPGCHHRWDGELKGAELCGDCWRKAQPVLLGDAREGTPEQQNDPQWQCSGCANWWPGWKRLCDMCGKTFWTAKIVRGDCENSSPIAAEGTPAEPEQGDIRREVQDKLAVAISASNNPVPLQKAIVLKQCEDFLVSMILEAEATRRSLQAQIEALKPFLQHGKTCETWNCQNCGHSDWLHDFAEDCDGVSCIHQEQWFTAKVNCTCGLAATLPATEET